MDRMYRWADVAAPEVTVRRGLGVDRPQEVQVTHDGRGAFTGLPSPLSATRYHSLSIERATLPPELEVTATADDGEIMGVRHRRFEVEGVQFHPEAFLTEHGHALLRNFLEGKS